jgi:hypothetical protein
MRPQILSPQNLSQEDFFGMETAKMAITLGNHHWYQQHQANAVVHPITGKEMEYMASFKEFGTFLEPTHVSFSNLQTPQKPYRSLMAK